MSFILNPYRYGFVNANSLSFDGTNEYVDCGNDSSLDFERTDAFSISGWFYFDTLGVQYIFSKAKTTSVQEGIYAYMRSDDKIQFVLRGTSGTTNAVSFYSNTTLNTSTWYHLTFTYDGTSLVSGANIYINNSVVTKNTTYDALSSSISNTGNFEIGDFNANSIPFDGYIDEVSIWDKELSSTEVTELYNSGCPNDLNSHSAYANLVSWWRMGDGDTISSITDQVGSNDGTPTNMDSSNITTTTPC